MIEMDRRIKIILIVYCLMPLVSALYDSCITISDSSNTVCQCIDDLDNCGRAGEYICMDGTDDHFIYFIPCSDVPDVSNHTGLLNYFALKPLNVGMEGFTIFFALLVGFGVIYAVTNLLKK